MSYRGVIIEESLENKNVLDDVQIVSTEIEPVTPKHETPWLTKWTLHKIIVPEHDAQRVAEKISHSLDRIHAWYADFKNDDYWFIIFREKVFFIDRTNMEQHAEVKRYGMSLGIPEHQVDFKPKKHG